MIENLFKVSLNASRPFPVAKEEEEEVRMADFPLYSYRGPGLGSITDPGVVFACGTSRTACWKYDLETSKTKCDMCIRRLLIVRVCRLLGGDCGRHA